MAKAIMIQGTMSDAGKSLLCTGLCRVFYQDGYKVAPFKSQNMAPNSFITEEGLEMGGAQAVQAEAAGIAPSVLMNPILLKPSSDMGSQLIVNGVDQGHFKAREYYKMKDSLVQEIKNSYDQLAENYDIIVLEGAGSPAELNLKEGDFVNMGMAKMAKAPVLLVGDIDRGGVFAQLYGTIALLEEDEQEMVKATVVNKFRGDPTLFQDGIKMIEQLTKKPVAGVMPYIKVDIEEEDSLAKYTSQKKESALLDLAVIRFPRISNFTDVAPFEAMKEVSVRFVAKASDIGTPDLVIIPGTKNPMDDLKWLRKSGLEEAIKELADKDIPILGIGAGFQMLGLEIEDDEGKERLKGLELLPVKTKLTDHKKPQQLKGEFLNVAGVLHALSHNTIEGFEYQTGVIKRKGGVEPLIQLQDGKMDGCQKKNVYGTNIHGLFTNAACREAILTALSERKGVTLKDISFDWQAYKESQYDLLADAIRENLDMELIYEILEEGI